ncbi:MAG: hypothetical protein JJE49_02830 [Peptostreptococcaceae bacterium]|nr:hypothetical protein [Peptostreptococcaceae bacterium]
MLTINMLGKVNINYEGTSIADKTSSKLVALICLLVLNKSRDMSKEKIISYLWPDSNEEAAKSNLRFNLWSIKKIIPQDVKGEEFINVGKDYCRINQKYKFYCDKIELDKYKAYGEEDIEKLMKLKSLLKGDFLEGLYLRNCNDFNELILFERVVCQNKQVEILKKLVTLYEGLEKYEEGLQILNEIDVIEPYNENFAFQTITMYSKLGNRAGAINYYKKFENNLRRNLNISPDKELKILYSNLIEGSHEIKNNERVNNRKKKLNIESHCISNVEYFWVSDVINKIMEKGDEKYLLEVGKCIISDLGFIQSDLLLEYEKHYVAIQDCSVAVPPVRIINAFIKFLLHATEIYDINIKVVNKENMDVVSQNILNHIETLNNESIFFEY